MQGEIVSRARMRDQRQWRIELARDVAIVARRSAGRDFGYSVVLVARRGHHWETVRVFDNAHGVREHHEHRYLGAERQAPIVSYGPEHLAMAEAIATLGRSWADIVGEWDRSR